MGKTTVHSSLIRAILRALTLRTDAPLGCQLCAALETLNEEIDKWVLSRDGLNTLVDNDKQSSLSVSDSLVRAAMLVAARRLEVPVGTRLRIAIERFVTELDTWAVNGSLKKQQRQRHQSGVVSRKVGERS
jgi:hypothetical protein